MEVEGRLAKVAQFPIEDVEALGLPFLGEITIDLSIRLTSDSGKPVALDDSTPHAKIFQEVAGNLAAQVSIVNMQQPQEISIE